MNKWRILCWISLFASGELNAQKTDSLKKDSFQKDLNEVIISGNIFPEKRKNIVQKNLIISNSQIKSSNAQTTADLLQQTGEVFVQKSQQGGGSPVLRGFEASRIQLNIDGVKYNNAIFRSGHLQNIIAVDPNALDKIEVLLGPASTLHGSDALGGVILLKTKEPKLGNTKNVTINSLDFLQRNASVNRENTTSVGISMGNNKWAALTQMSFAHYGDLIQGKNGPQAENGSWLKTFQMRRIDGKDSVMSSQNPYLQANTGYQQFDLLQKFSFAPSANLKHNLNLQLSNSSNINRYDRLTELNTSGQARFAEWYYGPQIRTLAAYKMDWQKVPGFLDDFSLNLSHQLWKESRNSRVFGAEELQMRQEQIHILGYTISARKKGKTHEISLGTDAQMNYLKSTASGLNIITNARQKIDSRYPDGKNNMNLFGFFVQHTAKLQKGKLVLNDGLRITHTTLYSTILDTSTMFQLPISELSQRHQAITGNAGLAYMPNESLRLTANFSTGFRSPNLDDMTKIFESNKNQLIVPNPNLKPEYTQNYELGLQLNRKAMTLNVYGFYTDFLNAIVTDAFTFRGQDSALYNGAQTKVYASQNKAKAYLTGAGSTATFKLCNKLILSTQIHYTYGRFFTDSGKVPLDHIPPLIGRIAMKYATKRWVGEVYSLYNGAKKLADYNPRGEDNLIYATPNGMPTWYTLNIRYDVSITNRINLQAGIENLLDRNYRYFASGISAPGRNFFIALRYRQ